MSVLITTRSPSSYQLRLAASNCRKYPSSSIYIRMHVHKLDHPIRCSLNSDDNLSQRRTSSKFSANAFSGWSGDDNGIDVLQESPPKKNSYGGIVGAAVAGVVLVAGLSFATLSISKRMSRTKKTMETLTTHQEESLTSADQNDNLEAEGPKSENGDSHLHETQNETATEDSIPQEELPKPAIQSDTVETPGIPNSDVDDDLVDSSTIESLDDTEKLESDDNLKEDVPDVNSVIPDSDLQETDEVDIGSKIENFDNKETQGFLELFSEGEVLDGGFSIPIPEPELAMDLEKMSSSASIPAPSVVSPALQTIPGKVLVPAVVDSVQGQALAALQVLKVIEGDVQPGDLCTRREYARWLVSASSALSRNTLSKM